uniref:Uncharacterized protein n=2 Tax=Anguilla anguilla TaxID=7936 RepID=A0A0E9UY26_ANGAN
MPSHILPSYNSVARHRCTRGRNVLAARMVDYPWK